METSLPHIPSTATGSGVSAELTERENPSNKTKGKQLPLHLACSFIMSVNFCEEVVRVVGARGGFGVVYCNAE